ncbi:hypothetical protein RB598_004461 [Gaeumannomyces tritici]
MSPTMHMTAPVAHYQPTSDMMDRHEYGVMKSRKTASTGGGRAWSEDEEVYLLQTRLQKMPYKHIAAHLKKTELACRLHYHQLSHGSNRRKRTTSVSSGSSTGGHSPVLTATIPSPIHESSSRSVSPTCSMYGPGSPAGGVQLPAIMSGGGHHSPRLPAILPKPASMNLALASPPVSRGYPVSMSDMQQQHVAPLLPAANFTSQTSSKAAPSSSHHHPNLRLDCSGLPPPAAPTSQQHMPPVDLTRLSAIYAAHRNGFWSSIAAEYGHGASPAALEQAWRNGPSPCCSGAHRQQAMTPITPVLSPEDREAYGISAAKSDKTRISAILGIDADPRSPKEREMVRRMEERVGA